MRTEARPRRSKSTKSVTVSRKVTALAGGIAATLVTLFLLTEGVPSLTASLVPRALSQNQPVVSQPSPTPSPAPSPSPSPTPPPNLHQWGAVTSFHGLPSDRTHAIAQTEFGVTWFATDGGLARYDGRRTNAINEAGLPAGRVLALKVDDDGALWIGTDGGAVRLANGKFEPVKETTGKVITAIITPAPHRAIIATESGQIFDCRVESGGLPAGSVEPGEGRPDLTFVVKAIPDQPLQSADKNNPGPLKITSLAMVGNRLYAGTANRGIVEIESGQANELVSKPRSFFINALETDAKGRLWVGARGGKDESALFDQSDVLRPVRAGAATGPVTAIGRGAADDIWIGTDGRGAFHLSDGKVIEHFTFEETGGGLRSDHIFGVFVDQQEVVWFATDKGVCRYDPHAMRAEAISTDATANYVRALMRTPGGELLAGTNAGLFRYDAAAEKWQLVPELGRRIIYALNEANGRVLAGTASGLFAATSSGELRFSRVAAGENLPQGDNIRAIAAHNGATYLATFGYGVEKLDGLQRQLVWPGANAEAQQREITCLATDQNNRLVIGTANAGVFFFDGRQTTTEPALERLKGDAVWAITSQDSTMWLASARGLYSFSKNELREIAPGINARALATAYANGRRGPFSCATVGNGLLRVAPDDQFGAVISRLDIEQGLPSQRVFAVWSEANSNGGENLIVGTSRGIVRYETERVVPTVLPARVISQRIHDERELKEGLRLDYPQNSLLLDVTAISSRTFPEQFQYGFALYNSSGSVIRQKLSHDSQFAMETLTPGKYRVVARAFTKDLLPATPLAFEFTVAQAPFPWTSTALAVLLLLALIALGWGYVQNRRIHRTSAELAHANRDLAEARFQLANETEAERRRIARDLHDQTLADLRNLALLVDQLPMNTPDAVRPNRAPSAPSALRHEIESISQEVRRICEDLSPSALENVGLSAALQFALAHAVEHAPPDCRFTHEFVCEDALDDKLHLPPTSQIQIYRIAQEALSNICRHANAKHVTMTASTSREGAFELRIEDDGRGFDESGARNSTGRGIANIRARASMIDAQVSWAKRNGGGTVFGLTKKVGLDEGPHGQQAP